MTNCNNDLVLKKNNNYWKMKYYKHVSIITSGSPNHSVLYGFLQIYSFWEKCDQFGFLIHICKRWKLCKGSSNDYSCIVWVQSNFQFLRKLFYFIFPNGPIFKKKSCYGGHLGFMINTKSNRNLKCSKQTLPSTISKVSDRNNFLIFSPYSILFVLRWQPSWIFDWHKKFKIL
jgi:hypothetical protein